MRETVRNILLLSAIIVATPSVFSSVFGFFIFLGFSDLLLSCSCLMGILAYIGLWRNLIFDDNKRRNSILLLIGIVGISIFMFVEGGKRMIKWFFAFEEPFEIFMFLWPLIVSAIILLFNYRMHLQNKDRIHQKKL